MQRSFTTDHPLRRRTVWRGVVGCVVAYALVITALLSGLVQSEWVAQAAAGLVGERCAADAHAAGSDPAVPAGQPDDADHCALCTLAVGPAVLPVAPAVAFLVLLRPIVPSGGGDHHLVHWTGHPAKLPRGPPHAGFEA